MSVAYVTRMILAVMNLETLIVLALQNNISKGMKIFLNYMTPLKIDVHSISMWVSQDVMQTELLLVNTLEL